MQRFNAKNPKGELMVVLSFFFLKGTFFAGFKAKIPKTLWFDWWLIDERV